MSNDLKLIEQCDICSHYLSAIFNDDFSGLSDDDEKLVRTWLAATIPQWSTLDIAGEPSFKRDEISGLMADCETVEIWGYIH